MGSWRAGRVKVASHGKEGGMLGGGGGPRGPLRRSQQGGSLCPSLALVVTPGRFVQWLGVCAKAETC